MINMRFYPGETFIGHRFHGEDEVRGMILEKVIPEHRKAAEHHPRIHEVAKYISELSADSTRRHGHGWSVSPNFSTLINVQIPDPAVEIAAKAVAEAEARRQAAVAEAQRQAAVAEAQRQAAAAEAQRRAAEAQRQAAAAAEARRLAEVEARRVAVEAEARRVAEAEARRQAAVAEAQRKAAEVQMKGLRAKLAVHRFKKEARNAAERGIKIKCPPEVEAEIKREDEARRAAEAEAEARRLADPEGEAKRREQSSDRLFARLALKKAGNTLKHGTEAYDQAIEAEIQRRVEARRAAAEARRAAAEAKLLAEVEARRVAEAEAQEVARQAALRAGLERPTAAFADAGSVAKRRAFYELDAAMNSSNDFSLEGVAANSGMGVAAGGLERRTAAVILTHEARDASVVSLTHTLS